jgi:hypothetical protein
MNTELLLNRNGRPHWLFIITVLWGALIPWLSNHLPMVDIAQHAAQIGLWRDLLLGTSAWEEYFRINLFTPYLLGYGIALPLSFLIGISASLKLMLSVAYIAFVYLCVRLRQEFNGDPRLDWLYVITFFGYAYKWGFFTFLVAAPVGLLFILYANQYSKGPTLWQAIKLLITGVVLLAFHGLVFVYAVGAGICMHLLRNFRNRGVLRNLWPFLLLVAICGMYFLVNKKFSADMPTNLDSAIKWDYGFDRILKAIVYLTTPNANLSSMLIPIAISFIMLTVPWLMGLKINWRNPIPLVPLALTVFILGFVPNYAFSTALLYQRFALFLLPAYAWTFLAPQASDSSLSKARWQKIMVLVLMLSTWLYLGLHTVRTIRFNQESAGIDRIISQLKPQQRALTMAFDPDSEANSSIKIYAHYPAWYQAERGGLVDFNFAWFPPQIVRYRSDHLPAIEPGFEWNVNKFNWQQHRGDEFHYFFVRYSEPPISDIFHGAPCPPKLVAESGLWKIYERLPCEP